VPDLFSPFGEINLAHGQVLPETGIPVSFFDLKSITDCGAGTSNLAGMLRQT
jgi:hypothetical protein